MIGKRAIAILLTAVILGLPLGFTTTAEISKNRSGQVGSDEMAFTEEKEQSVKTAVYDIQPRIFVPEESDGATDKEKFGTLRSYFQHLYEFSPYNEKGSCVYVSLIQLLSYYDTFFNDTVIPEQYDVSGDYSDYNNALLHSPGTLKQYCPENVEYSQFVRQTVDINFQSYLMSLNDMKITANFEDYQGILDQFCSVETKVSITKLPDETSDETQEEYKKMIRESIEAGQPVILGIRKKNINEEGHSVLSYVTIGEYIYANFGWSSSETIQCVNEPASKYRYINRLITVDFPELRHIHSDNYSINGVKYCGCGVHTHQCEYLKYNSNKHIATCYCGYSKLLPHVYKGSGRLRFCACGQSADSWTDIFPGYMTYALPNKQLSVEELQTA